MYDLVFTSTADEALTRLEQDPARERTLNRIWDALDELAADPSAPAKNERLYRLGDGVLASGFSLNCEGEEWLIAWSRTDAEVIVRYVGSDL